MLGDGAGEDGRICSACTEALPKRFEIGMLAGANVLLKRPPGLGHEEQAALSLPTLTPHPRQYKP